jgi:integrase
MAPTPSSDTQELPRRTSATEAAYATRYRQLCTAARSDAVLAATKTGLKPPLTANVFVDWLLAKRDGYKANSWRQVRRSAVFGMNEDAKLNPRRAPAIHAAIAKLQAAAPPRGKDLPPKTSSTKAKRFLEADLDRVCFAALASRSPNSKRLVAYLRAATICGCRPCEWPSATLRRSAVPGFQWELIVPNAKNTNGRSTGEARTLRWTELSNDQVDDITAWIAFAQEKRYDTLLDTLGSLMSRLTGALFPHRKLLPTLYSTRHEATARWKATYLSADQSIEQRIAGLATVAALLGHISDETASKHYGRPRRGSKEMGRFPAPHADPTEVAKIRRRLDLDRLVLRATLTKNGSSPS